MEIASINTKYHISLPKKIVREVPVLPVIAVAQFLAIHFIFRNRNEYIQNNFFFPPLKLYLFNSPNMYIENCKAKTLKIWY